MSRKFKTAEAAKAVGIHQVTLQDWIRTGRIRPPKPTLFGARAVRLWSQADLKRLRKVKAKTYRKGRGRKKKVK